jgi:hypothetical protein
MNMAQQKHSIGASQQTTTRPSIFTSSREDDVRQPQSQPSRPLLQQQQQQQHDEEIDEISLEDVTLNLQTMKQLIDRMWEEGLTYMKLRSRRMEELLGPKPAPSQQESTDHEFDDGNRREHDHDADEDNVYDDEEEEEWIIRDGERRDGSRNVDGISQGMIPATLAAEHDDVEFSHIQEMKKELEMFSPALEEMDEEISTMSLYGGGNPSGDLTHPIGMSYLDDFALPGPTVAMFDTLLDAMACHCTSPVSTPAHAATLLRVILSRHQWDGGDTKNTNVHTKPTALSWNAPIRLVSNMPYDPTDKRPSRIKRRDEALLVAFGTFSHVSQSHDLLRNSATYAYLLQIVAKYFPPSRIRGNIAHGIWHHAMEQGLIDEMVLDSYLRANTPSNGAEFDNYRLKNLDGKTFHDLPATWKKFSRVKRFHIREATY